MAMRPLSQISSLHHELNIRESTFKVRMFLPLLLSRLKSTHISRFYKEQLCYEPYALLR